LTDFEFNLGDFVEFDGEKGVIYRRTLDEAQDESADIRYSVEMCEGAKQCYFNIRENQLTLWSKRKIERGDTLHEDTTVDQLNGLPIGTVFFSEVEDAFFFKTATGFYTKVSRNTALADSSPNSLKVITVFNFLNHFIKTASVTVKYIPGKVD